MDPSIASARVADGAGGDDDGDDPLIAMADPAADSRIVVISPGALDVACRLLRRGFPRAMVLRIEDGARARQADVVIIPQVADPCCIERAVGFARRLLTPLGVVVVRLPGDGMWTGFARRQLVAQGFTAIRVKTSRGETLLGASVPLYGRLVG